MKTFISLFFFSIALIFVTNLNAQITSCTNCSTPDQLKVEGKPEYRKEPTYPIVGIGINEADAVLDAKKQFVEQTYLKYSSENNIGTIKVLRDRANRLVGVTKDDYSVGKLSPRERRELSMDRDAKKCFLEAAYINEDIIEQVAAQIDNYILASTIFIINPWMPKLGDSETIELYKKARNKMHTAFGGSCYNFNNIKVSELIPDCGLKERSNNFNPCTQEILNHKTGSPFYDFVECMRINYESQIEMIFIIDTIETRLFLSQEDWEVTFTIRGFNTNTKTEVLIFSSVDTVNADCENTAVKIAIANVFQYDCERAKKQFKADPETLVYEIDKWMYQITERYMDYIMDGEQFIIRICEPCVDEVFIEKFYNCNCFDTRSIKDDDWKAMGGVIVGRVVKGRTYELNLRRLLKKMLTTDMKKTTKIIKSGNEIILKSK